MSHTVWVILISHGFCKQHNSTFNFWKKYHMVRRINCIGISTNRMIFLEFFCHEARRFLMKISSRISFELDQLCLREIDWNRMATNNKQSKYWSTMKQEPKRLLKNKNLYFDKKGFDVRAPRAKNRSVYEIFEAQIDDFEFWKGGVFLTGTLKLTDNEENESAESSATWIFFSAKCAHATKHHQQVKNN